MVSRLMVHDGKPLLRNKLMVQELVKLMKLMVSSKLAKMVMKHVKKLVKLVS